MSLVRLYAIVDLIYSIDKRSYDEVDYFDGRVKFIKSSQLKGGRDGEETL